MNPEPVEIAEDLRGRHIELHAWIHGPVDAYSMMPHEVSLYEELRLIERTSKAEAEVRRLQGREGSGRWDTATVEK